VARILFHPTAEFYTAHRILSGVLSMSTKIGGIFIGSLLILVVGIVDDKVGLLPLQKLAGQIVAAIILMSLGLTINLFSDLL
jgi:UDP-GlcNAc:undecaprenyl-phosphate GlcNAc-1-phosphate transferase